MDTDFKKILFWIVSVLTGITLLFSTDLINLIINSFIIMITLIVYYDCNFCPKEEDSTKNKDNESKDKESLIIEVSEKKVNH